MIAAADLEHLVDVYPGPGAFTAIGWYRAGTGLVVSSLADQVPALENQISTTISVLWPEYDPLFVREWSDRLDKFFSDVTVHTVDGSGHFTPVGCPAEFAG